MKKLLLIGLFSTFLVGCGGGGSSDSDTTHNIETPPKSEQQQAAGIYSGETSQDQSIDILVQEDGVFWAFYSVPHFKAALGGVVQGSFQVSGNTATSQSAKDFYEGYGVAPVMVNTKVDAHKSLSGTIERNPSNVNKFEATYDLDRNQEKPDLALIRGTHYGGGTHYIIIKEDNTIYGRLIGDCELSGRVAPATDGRNYYTLQITYGQHNCTFQGQTATGVIFPSKENRKLNMIFLNPDRNNGYYGVTRVG